MKFVDEYRDPAAARLAIAQITERAAEGAPNGGPTSSWRCAAATPTPSTSTASRTCCPEPVELVHGPGCPVCVIPMGRVDDAIAVAETPSMIFTSFGDMMRVPGGNGEPAGGQGPGAPTCGWCTRPLDALRIADANPDKQVVFFAVGFETTAPSTAVTVLKARQKGVTNFSVFCNHVTIVPPLKAILESPDLRLERLPRPRPRVHRHRQPALPVRARPSTACPWSPPASSPSTSSRPSSCCSRQIDEGRCEVENQYTRAVSDHGNPRALAILQRGLRAAAPLRVAGPGLHLPVRPQAQRRVRRLRRRAALQRARRPGGRPQGLPVR